MGQKIARWMDTCDGCQHYREVERYGTWPHFEFLCDECFKQIAQPVEKNNVVISPPAGGVAAG